MAGSTIGTIFRVTTWGESHGEAVGAVIDGCPAGLALSEDDIQLMLDRRRAQGANDTDRHEPDRCRILSGTFNGVTTGTPISVIVDNVDVCSEDYEDLKDVHRPGHADLTYDIKYGFRDWRGGGRASGRETVGRVIAGAIAEKLLEEFGIEVNAMAQEERPGYGGIVTCIATGVPAGLGEPVFDKTEAEIAKAVMSIGAVKGIEFGTGFMSAQMNTQQYLEADMSGGTLGGITDGTNILLNAAVKPVPSLGLKGRFDKTIVGRVAVVVEAMVAVTLADLLLRNRASRIDAPEQ